MFPLRFPRFLLLGFLFLGGLFGSARTEAAFRPVGRDVGVSIHATPHPALGDLFLKENHSHSVRILRALLGSSATIKEYELPKLQSWLAENSLSELTTSHCRQFQCDQAEVMLLASLRYERGAYVVEVVEYNRHFDQLGSPLQAKVVQRDMVVQNLGKLLLTAWSPVGEILQKDHEEFLIRFPQEDRLLRLPQWSHLKPGSVLQIFRELELADGLHQSRHQSQFLKITSTTSPLFAAPVLPQKGSNWFDNLRQPNARYLVRLCRLQADDISVRVLVEDTNVPREGCLVWLTNRLPKPGEELGDCDGTTNAQGAFTSKAAKEMMYVTIATGSERQTKAVLPGVGNGQVVFEIQPTGGKPKYLAQLKRLEDNIQDGVRLLNDQISKIQSAIDRNDYQAVQTLVTEAQTILDVPSLRTQLNQISQNALGAGVDIRQDLGIVTAKLDQAEQQFDFSQQDQAKVGARIQELAKEIADAKQAGLWLKYESRLKEYIRLRKGIGAPDAAAEKQLAQIQNQMKPNNVQHAQARTIVENAASIQTIDQLISQWNKFRAAADVLLQEDDPIWLRSAQTVYVQANKLLGQESTVIEKAVTSGALTQEDRQKLENRITELEKITEDLKRLEASTVEKLKGM
ncbi:MAG: hypothetical protein KDA84_01715 [Planctomycetaceae bacterium]|nr:hypothetical protein [Planctomycetaceae bacterium]